MAFSIDLVSCRMTLCQLFVKISMTNVWTAMSQTGIVQFKYLVLGDIGASKQCNVIVEYLEW